MKVGHNLYTKPGMCKILKQLQRASEVKHLLPNLAWASNAYLNCCCDLMVFSHDLLGLPIAASLHFKHSIELTLLWRGIL